MIDVLLVLGWVACGVASAGLFGTLKLDNVDRGFSYFLAVFAAPVALTLSLAVVAYWASRRRAELREARHAAAIAEAEVARKKAAVELAIVERELQKSLEGR